MNPDPTDAGTDAATAAFLVEAGHLKRTKRAGWWIAGIRDPESVAEHSYRVAVVGYVLAVMEGANPDRTAALCVFHDVPETRLGDIPSTGRQFIKTLPPGEVIAVQTAGIPVEVGGPIRDLIAEFEAKATREALCAKDADKLECLLQALEYLAQGYEKAQPWVDTMAAAVRTESGKRLAEAALSTPVDEWWREIVSSYGMVPANAEDAADPARHQTAEPPSDGEAEGEASESAPQPRQGPPARAALNLERPKDAPSEESGSPSLLGNWGKNKQASRDPERQER